MRGHRGLRIRCVEGQERWLAAHENEGKSVIDGGEVLGWHFQNEIKIWNKGDDKESMGVTIIVTRYVWSLKKQPTSGRQSGNSVK